jgi:hypothetical protein
MFPLFALIDKITGVALSELLMHASTKCFRYSKKNSRTVTSCIGNVSVLVAFWTSSWRSDGSLVRGVLQPRPKEISHVVTDVGRGTKSWGLFHLPKIIVNSARALCAIRSWVKIRTW